MYKLIMLNKPILVSDEEVKVNDWVTDGQRIAQVNALTIDDPNKHLHKKIIAGIPELPSIDFYALSDEDCKKIGWVDVEKLAKEFCERHFTEYGKLVSSAYVSGFKKSQSLNEKKFSEEDIRKAVERTFSIVFQNNLIISKDLSKIQDDAVSVLSQPKVFDVEVEMKTKCYCGHTDWCDCSENQGSPFIQQPKITNNSIKVIKVL